VSAPLRVLATNHTALVSGAERALLDLLAALPPPVEAVLACPDGELRRLALAGGVPVVTLPGTAGSLRLHPRHTAVAVAQLARAGVAIRGAAGRAGAAVVHANSIRSGISAALARTLGGPPVVTSVHDCLPPGPVTRGVTRAIDAGSAALVANSRHTAGCLGPRAGADAVVAYNPIDLDAFAHAGADRDRVRAELGAGPEDELLGVVAQITPWKGQETAVRALAELRRARPAARLALVGSTKFVSAATRYDNEAYLRELRATIAALGLDGAVHFAGEREDVPAVLAALDLVLVPSWEEPFGRVVVEAMAAGTPVLATAVGGPAEIVEDGVSGRLLPPRDPSAWARAAAGLLGDPSARDALAERGRERARDFARGAYAERLVEVWTRAAAGGRPSRA
jgi:glycosyltransferase involved in cell wall biosynthesis